MDALQQIFNDAQRPSDDEARALVAGAVGLGEDIPLTVVSNAPEAENRLQLVYFALRGKGELPRIILEASGTPYDCLWVWEGAGRWDDLKQHMPYGQIPVLVTEGGILSQFDAVVRHLARVTGLYGATELQRARIDELVAVSSQDVWGGGMRRVARGRDTSPKAVTRMGSLLAAMERDAAAAGPSGWLVGDALSIADLSVFHHVSYLRETGASLDTYPALGALLDRVAALPNVAAYLASPRRFPPTHNEMQVEGCEELQAGAHRGYEYYR